MSTHSSTQGFMPLSNMSSYNNMQMDGIPLTAVRSNSSSTGMRRAGEDGVSPVDFATPPNFPNDGEKAALFNRAAGRRKKKSDELGHIRRVDSEGEETSLTTMGRIYNK